MELVDANKLLKKLDSAEYAVHNFDNPPIDAQDIINIVREWIEEYKVKI